MGGSSWRRRRDLNPRLPVEGRESLAARRRRRRAKAEKRCRPRLRGRRILSEKVCNFFRIMLNWLPDHDSNVDSPVNNRMSCHWTIGKWWRHRESNPARRSCKDRLQPAAIPILAPGVGFEPTSPRLRRGAVTRSASQAVASRCERIGADEENRTPFAGVALRH
jgi:hypothetical protein